MSNVIKATDSNFEEIINDNDVVVVHFWAEWSGPCKMLSPILEDLAGDGVVVAKLDVDANPNSPKKYNIRNIPTILFFRDGEIAEKQEGTVTKNAIEEKLERVLRN